MADILKVVIGWIIQQFEDFWNIITGLGVTIIMGFVIYGIGGWVLRKIKRP